MSKRHRKETCEEKWTRLMEDYERRFQDEDEMMKTKPKRRRIIYSSSSNDEDDVQIEEHLGTANEATNTLQILNSAESSSKDDFPVADPVDSFDPDLLKALGEVETEVVEYGEEMQSDIAKRFQQILVNGLNKDTREELTKKYLFSKNVPMSKAPTLNPEISAMLVETCRLRDKRLLAKQDQLGRALSALGKAMTFLLKKDPDISEVVKTLNDAGKLVADSHFAETETRRSVITPLIEKSYIETLKDRKRDSFLFGDKLGDLVNNSKGIKKTSQIIQASTSANAGLNWKGPSHRARQQRAGQYNLRCVGGPLTNYPQANRRRGPPLPPAGRRYPQFIPPPPPPPLPPARRQPPQAQRSFYRHRN